MSQNTIQLLLGSNLNDRKKNLEDAQSLIQKEIGGILKTSEIIETQPEGFDSEFSFLNQTLILVTSLSPIQLLHKIKHIEKEIGRIYIPTNQKYQDRIIDIDILLFNQIKFESTTLNIPHHQIISRKFVKKILN